MKNDNTLGVIYDSIFYNVIFFNKEKVRTLLEVTAEKKSDIFKNFDEFCKNKYITQPSDKLYPFFYKDFNISCLLTEYFLKHFDFFGGTYEGFIGMIKNTDYFKRFVFYYYLEALRADLNVESVIRGDSENIAIASALLSKAHPEYAKQIVHMFYHFEELVDELAKYLYNLFHKMKIFHSNRENTYLNIVNNFCNSDNSNIFIKNNGINNAIKLKKQHYSISLMNRYIVMFKNKGESEEFSFILGDESYNTSISFSQYKNVTAYLASKIFATPIMNDIIWELKKGEKTITQLSFILHVSRTTVDRFVSELYDESAIKISGKIGREVYYNLNPAFFITAKEIYSKNIDKLINK